MSRTRCWRPNEPFIRYRNRESGGGIAAADDRLLHAVERAAEAAKGRGPFAQSHDRRADPRDRDRRARDRRPQAHGPRRQRKPRQPACRRSADGRSPEAAARRRRQCGPSAVQDRDCGAAGIGTSIAAGPGDGQGIGRQGGCRRGAGVFRSQKVRWPCRMKSFRDIRVIPVVLVAIFGLVVLKIAGLVIDGGYVFDYQPAPARSSWAQDNLNFPGGKEPLKGEDVTGSVDKPKEEKKDEAAKPAVAAPATKPDGVGFPPEDKPPGSAPGPGAPGG